MKTDRERLRSRSTAPVLALMVGLHLFTGTSPAAERSPAPKPGSTTNALSIKKSKSMTNAIPEGYDYHVVSPTNHSGLTFRFLKPADFKIADLPNETPDFEKTTAFMPLVIAVTQYGPMVFSVAARPAYEDGAVEQWLSYLLGEEGYKAEAITESRLGNLPAVTCDALQKTEDVTMKMRFVLLEDGGRIIQVTAMAPEPFWTSALQKFAPMLASFELREVRGTKVPLLKGGAVPAAVAAAPETKPEAAKEQPAAEKPKDTEKEKPSQSSGARLTPKELAALALAETAESLDPEQKMNANLRNNGVGFVPRVVSVDLPGKSARLAAAAVQGTFRIPLGWHAIDDGKRTLIFDSGGRIQVNLSQRLHEGASTRDFARGCLDQYLEQQPDLTIAHLELDSIAGAGVRGAKIEGETLDQYFLVRDVGRKGLHLVARVTANSADATRALDLAGDIMATFEGPASDTL